MYGGRGYAAEANDQIACIAMIETEDGIANLEEILTTEGLDGVYIGPSDLALALGMRPVGDNDDPKHAATVQQILDDCRKHGVAAGIHTSSLEYTQRYLKAGFNFVTLGSDTGFMMRAAGEELAAARGTQAEEREKTGY
jgi:4-hydroxy-2-oxoheptanedioate aldolase